jgi:hypothetical protein
MQLLTPTRHANGRVSDTEGVPRTIALVLASLVLASCYGSAAGPSPADMTSLVAALAARGFAIEQTTGGDPGCAGSPLYRDATRLDLVDSGSRTTYVLYVFGWRNQGTFDAAADEFAACVADFEAASGTAVGSTLSAGLWRAYGPHLDPTTTARLGDALAAAAHP